ncbi:hypothetical protein [Morganella morganii]
MPNKIFLPKYNPVERVAFDMALYPECYKAADNQRKREYPGSHVKLHSVG